MSRASLVPWQFHAFQHVAGATFFRRESGEVTATWSSVPEVLWHLLEREWMQNSLTCVYAKPSAEIEYLVTVNDGPVKPSLERQGPGVAGGCAAVGGMQPTTETSAIWLPSRRTSESDVEVEGKSPSTSLLPNKRDDKFGNLPESVRTTVCIRRWYALYRIRWEYLPLSIRSHAEIDAPSRASLRVNVSNVAAQLASRRVGTNMFERGSRMEVIKNHRPGRPVEESIDELLTEQASLPVC
ncbi:hypothetical protein BJ322DRAFT_1017334 [Thelephora terrestris]|uniref:Uncharacterized protein n=1 Tax=Thelephora terrestris TaxID=56493 RepID=A0A9P6LB09_9AGAM|nr:hypothetical protein BJ322DRAFT_1017334 [Thelephora terrestris]